MSVHEHVADVAVAWDPKCFRNNHLQLGAAATLSHLLCTRWRSQHFDRSPWQGWRLPVLWLSGASTKVRALLLRVRRWKLMRWLTLASCLVSGLSRVVDGKKVRNELAHARFRRVMRLFAVGMGITASSAVAMFKLFPGFGAGLSRLGFLGGVRLHSTSRAP